MSAFNVGKKVSAAVRILQRKRDASARATHLKAENWIVQYSTNERKQMSTKTSIKRIALVAAAALTLGGFSAVSASAAVNATSLVTSINLKNIATSNKANAPVTINAGATVLAAASAGDTMPFNAVLTAYPAGGFVQVSAKTTISAGSTAGTDIGATVSQSGAILTFTGVTAQTVTASATVGMGSFTFTPTVAGTYTLTVWNDPATVGTVDATETRQTIDIVVAAAAGYSNSLSTLLAGTGAAYATSTTDALPIAASKTTGTQAANIRVGLVDSSGVAYTGETVTASVAGPGLLGQAQSNAGGTDSDTTSGTLRSTTVVAANGFASVTVWPDGTSGTSVVTISVTDKVSGATTTLGSKSITFYGSVAKLTNTATYTIAPSGGGYLGAGSAATPISNRILATDIPAVVVKAVDSSGNPVGGLTIKVVSSDTTVVNSASTGYCIGDVASATNLFSSGGTGFYNCIIGTPSTAASGKSATLTFEVLDPSDVLGVAYLTTTVPVTVGGAIDTETATLDAASYPAGGAMVLTVTAKDKSGNPAYDGQAALGGTVSGNKALGGTMPGTTKLIVGGKYSTSATTPTIFAPAVGGDFKVLVPLDDTAASTASINATVTDDAASAASSLALDAANAATDAANNAYDEAQNATQAASDALAAVTALSTQVSALIATVKSLAAMVAKIKAKVKA